MQGWKTWRQIILCTAKPSQVVLTTKINKHQHIFATWNFQKTATSAG